MTAPRRLAFAPISPAMALAVVAALAGCVRVNVQGNPQAWVESMADTREPVPPLRVATYNTSLYDGTSGGLIRRLENGDPGARKVAAVLQRVRPDLVLLNEFDFDAGHRAAGGPQRCPQFRRDPAVGRVPVARRAHSGADLRVAVRRPGPLRRPGRAGALRHRRRSECRSG